MPTIYQTYLRHARHYSWVLERVNRLYRRGGDDLNAGLRLFDLELENIQIARAWLMKSVDTDETVAKLSSAFCLNAAQVSLMREHPTEHRRRIESGLIAARHLKDSKAEASRLNEMGVACLAVGDVADAIKFLNASLAIAAEIKDHTTEASALGNLGVAYKDVGEVRRAIACLRGSLTLDIRMNNRQGVVWIYVISD